MDTLSSIGPSLNIRLLGPLQVNYEGQPPIDFKSNPARALLTYLAVESNQPHSRESLASFFWPESDKSKAGKNLSVTLSRLRKSLDNQTDEPIVQVTRKSIALNRKANIRVDLHTFVVLLQASQKHSHRSAGDCRACMKRYGQAAALLCGEFAEGLTLKDNLLFMEWWTLKREWVYRQALGLLQTLADFHLRRGELLLAQTYAHRQVELAPWREESHRQIMRIYARDGRAQAALAQYKQCEQMLAGEFGIMPSVETQALRARL